MKLITANHLKTGRVIYYQANPEGWTADPEAATAFPDAVAETRLAALEAAPGDALGPYLIPLSTGALEAKSGGEKACATAAQAPEPLGFSRRGKADVSLPRGRNGPGA